MDIPFLKNVLILFLAVLGLRYCTRAFSSGSEWGPHSVVVHRLCIAVASRVVQHRLYGAWSPVIAACRLSGCGSQALELGLSNCGAQA